MFSEVDTIEGLGFRAWGFGLRVQGSGLRVEGLRIGAQEVDTVSWRK